MLNPFKKQRHFIGTDSNFQPRIVGQENILVVGQPIKSAHVSTILSARSISGFDASMPGRFSRILIGKVSFTQSASIAQRLRIPTEVLQHCCHFASREYSSWLIEHPHGLYNLARHFNATLAAA